MKAWVNIIIRGKSVKQDDRWMKPALVYNNPRMATTTPIQHQPNTNPLYNSPHKQKKEGKEDIEQHL